jgi:diguanylate cyclase (GGDEF)-like protein
MDQGQTVIGGTNGNGHSRQREPRNPRVTSSWSIASANRLLDTQIREGIPPALFDGINRCMLDLLEKIEGTSLDRRIRVEKLKEIRTLLVKAAHSVAIQSEILSELRHLALTDDLTGFYNRRGFLILAMQQLKISRRTGQPMLLFFADVDRLKAVNDLYGHAEGDALLRRSAVALNNSFRESDILARLGGDEFAVLAAEGADRTCSAIASRLERAIEEVNAQEGVAPLSLSLGVARFDPHNPVSLGELLTSADCDMYQRKRSRHGVPVNPDSFISGG